MASQQNGPAARFEDYIRGKGLRVANTLNTLTPYERSLALQEAYRIWDDRQDRQPQSHEADDSVFYLSQWLAQTFTRLSPESQAAVLDMVQYVDEAERFERLLGE